MATRQHAAGLGLEVLEQRQLLAGTVDVSLEDGSLEISGDEVGNAIYVADLSQSQFLPRFEGTIVVFGLNGETITTSSPDSLLVLAGRVAIIDTEGLDGDLNVDLGGGIDALIVDGVNINGQLFINGGADTDVVALLNLDVDPQSEFEGAAAQIDMGLGNDLLLITGGFYDSLFANGSIGADLYFDGGDELPQFLNIFIPDGIFNFTDPDVEGDEEIISFLTRRDEAPPM